MSFVSCITYIHNITYKKLHQPTHQHKIEFALQNTYNTHLILALAALATPTLFTTTPAGTGTTKQDIRNPPLHQIHTLPHRMCATAIPHHAGAAAARVVVLVMLPTTAAAD